MSGFTSRPDPLNDLFGAASKAPSRMTQINSALKAGTLNDLHLGPLTPSPEVSTANIEKALAAPNPEPSGAAGRAPVPPPPAASTVTGDTSASEDSIFGLVQKATAEGNPLNKYYQATYHFRLFMAADGDAAENVNSPADLINGINNLDQVVIAESGVTGYNIKEVHLNTVDAGNDTTRTTPVTEFTITITEPNGISFPDALLQAGSGLKQANYTKATYYLELGFLGYDENGAAFASKGVNAVPGWDNGGRWIWSLRITTIDIKLNEAGAVYTIKALAAGAALLTEDYDLLRFPEPILAEGKTVRELYASYIDNLNKAWEKKYGGKIVVFKPVVTSKIGDFLKNPVSAVDKDPGNFKLVATEPDKNTKKNFKFDKGSNVYSISVVPGYPVLEFLVDAIKHTEEGQALAIDGGHIRTEVDKSGSEVNERKIRESIIWCVEIVVKNTGHDTTSNMYAREVEFHIIPRYVPTGILTMTQVNDEKTLEAQRAKVKNIIDNGKLKRRYDYLFTGLNTEVISFDLTFNMVFSNTIPAYGGALMKHEAIAFHAKVNDGNKSPDGTLPEVSPQEKTVIAELQKPPPKPASGGGRGSVHTPNAVNNTRSSVSAGGRGSTHLNQTNSNVTPFGPALNPELSGSTGRAQVQTPLTDPSATRVAPATRPTPELTYVEDTLLKAITQREYAIPVSITQGNCEVRNEDGSSNFPGQSSRDQSVFGAIAGQSRFSTTTYAGEKPTNVATLTLTIRGDPFWLGQSDLHRQVVLKNRSQLYSPRASLHDHVTGLSCVFINFRYPLMTGDDFKPMLKTSAVFNGVYEVKTVAHHFVDGEFKQDVSMQKNMLIDPNLWTGSLGASTNGGAASSPQMASPDNGPRAASADAGGPSPVKGVDYQAGDKTSFINAFAPLAQAQSDRTGVVPEVILAQAGLETGWGKSTPQNNFFGIKGGGLSLKTTEVVNGQTQTVNQNFAGYATAADSFDSYGNLLSSSHYSAVRNASGISAQAQALQASGYATDPQYANKVNSIAQSIKL